MGTIDLISAVVEVYIIIGLGSCLIMFLCGIIRLSVNDKYLIDRIDEGLIDLTIIEKRESITAMNRFLTLLAVSIGAVVLWLPIALVLYSDYMENKVK